MKIKYTLETKRCHGTAHRFDPKLFREAVGPGFQSSGVTEQLAQLTLRRF